MVTSLLPLGRETDSTIRVTGGGDGFERRPGVTNGNGARPTNHQEPAVQLDRKFEAPCLSSMETMKKALLLSLAMMMSTAAFAAAAPRPMPTTTKHKMMHQDKANHKWKKDKKWKKDHKKPKM